MKVLVNEEVDRGKWNKFVYDNPKGNVFQTYEMYEVYSKTKNYKPFLLAVVEDDKILAGLLVYISTEIKLLGSLTSRAIIQGGPLYSDNKEAVSFLVDYYDNLMKKKVVFTQIRNLYDVSEIKPVLTGKKYVYEDHLNFLIDLKKSEDELFDQIKKARRYAIRKGKERGTIVEEVKDSVSVDMCFDMLKQTYNDAKLPLADITLFKNAFNVLYPKEMIKLFVAKHSNNIIGTIIVLIYNGVIYDWYAGASKEHLRFYPNDILPWHAISFGAKNNYQTFDFGGAGNPNKEYGVREFKKQYGGELVNFGRFEKIHQPVKLKIAKKGFELYKGVKK